MADCIDIYYLGSHLGRHLKFLEMPNDDKVSSVRFWMLMVSTFKKHQNIFYAIQIQVQLRICRTNAFVWAIYFYIGNIKVICRSTVTKISLVGNLRWLSSCLCLLYFPATVLFTCIKSWFFGNHLANFHHISLDPTVEMWLIVYSNDHGPLTVRPIIYSSSLLRTAQMMIFSLVEIIRLEKCCITSAYLQWLCLSGEQAVARGPLVICPAQSQAAGQWLCKFYRPRSTCKLCSLHGWLQSLLS